MTTTVPSTELIGSSARREVDVASRVTMTLAEAAEVLGIHRTTAWSLHKRGEFPVPVLKIGSSLRVVKAHLQQFMETGEPVVPGTLVGASVSTAS